MIQNSGDARLESRRHLARWRKSSYSNNGGECVEVAPASSGAVVIRDSKNPTGPTLKLTATEWRTFLRAVKSGRVKG
jgi:hypothetical protein